jgi:hypothetical protein
MSKPPINIASANPPATKSIKFIVDIIISGVSDVH